MQWLDGLIGDSGGDWWFDLFMWVSDCRSSWLVGQIGDHWLGLLLAWASDCKVFFGSGFVDVVVDNLIWWWCFAGCWVSILLLGFDFHVL